MGEDELSSDWPAKIRQAAGQPDPPDLTVPSAMPSAMRQLPKTPSPPKVSVDLSRTAKPYTEPFVEKLLAQLCQLLVTTAELQSAPAATRTWACTPRSRRDTRWLRAC